MDRWHRRSALVPPSRAGSERRPGPCWLVPCAAEPSARRRFRRRRPAAGGSPVGQPVALADGGVKVDGQRIIARSGASRPGPSQQLPAHPLQLPDVAPRKLRRKVPSVDGALTTQPGACSVPPARSASASSMQSLRANADATRVSPPPANRPLSPSLHFWAISSCSHFATGHVPDPPVASRASTKGRSEGSAIHGLREGCFSNVCASTAHAVLPSYHALSIPHPISASSQSSIYTSATTQSSRRGRERRVWS